MRRSPRRPACEVTFAVVGIHKALTGIPTGINDIVGAVAIDIRNGHRGGARRIFQRTAIEVKLAVVQADIARRAAIGDRDIRVTIPVHWRPN